MVAASKKGIKEISLEGEILALRWDNVLQEWVASFTVAEIKSFIGRVKLKAKDKCMTRKRIESVIESYEIMMSNGSSKREAVSEIAKDYRPKAGGSP